MYYLGCRNVTISCPQFGLFLYIALIISVLLSIYLFNLPIMKRIIYGKDYDTIDFNENIFVHLSKFRIIIFFATYILTLLVSISIVFLLTWIIGNGHYEMSYADSGLSRDEYLYNLFFTFKSGENMIDMFDFYIIVLSIVLFGSMFYVTYALLKKNFLTDITFPYFVSDENEEKTFTDKYVIMYALQLLLIICFALVLVAYMYGVDKKLAMFLIFMFLFLIMIFTCKIFQYIIEKNKKKFIIFMVCFILLVVINPYIIRFIVTLWSKIWDTLVKIVSKKNN